MQNDMSEEQNKNREKREFERGTNFDVFVSYRRSDGKSFARTLNLAFKNEGFRCFLDYDKLEGGDFSRQLQDAVVDAPIFVMVMTPDYFARCVKKVETADGKTVFEPDEDDWVRREIELALSNGKIIIPIDVNGILNGTPDYLDKDFGNRVGCHQFSPVYDNNAFEATFDAMLNKNIWNRFYKFQKPTNKAEITVATDADCKLLKNNKLLATLQAGEHSLVLLGKGNHLLQARSEEFPEIFIEIEKEIEDVSCDDFIRIKLKDKVHRQQDNQYTSQQEDNTTQTDLPQVSKNESISPNDFRLLRTLEGHSEGVLSICWSPDGKYLASGSMDDTVVLWDVNTGQRIRLLRGHSSLVYEVCWSPNGKYLASGSGKKGLFLQTGEVIMWDANTGERIRTLKGHSDYVCSVCWSPDGIYLASGSLDGNIILWDANTGQRIRTLKTPSWSVDSVYYAPNGRYLASSSLDKTVKLWNSNSGEIILTLEEYSDYTYSVCWSPDGNYIISGSSDGTVIIWSVNSGKIIKTLKGHSDKVLSVSWSPDGKYLASGSDDKTVIIWDANSGERLKTLEGHSNDVTSVCWSPDGKYLASGSDDDTVKIWGVE